MSGIEIFLSFNTLKSEKEVKIWNGLQQAFYIYGTYLSYG
jgi:hypothetical protein